MVGSSDPPRLTLQGSCSQMVWTRVAALKVTCATTLNKSLFSCPGEGGRARLREPLLSRSNTRSGPGAGPPNLGQVEYINSLRSSPLPGPEPFAKDFAAPSAKRWVDFLVPGLWVSLSDLLCSVEY